MLIFTYVVVFIVVVELLTLFITTVNTDGEWCSDLIIVPLLSWRLGYNVLYVSEPNRTDKYYPRWGYYYMTKSKIEYFEPSDIITYKWCSNLASAKLVIEDYKNFTHKNCKREIIKV